MINNKISEIKSIKEDNIICVLGLGFVGLTLAITLAEIGFKVFGIEKNNNILNLLKKYKASFQEPGINNKIKKEILKKKFIISRDYVQRYKANIFILAVGTPLNIKNNLPNLNSIKSAINQIVHFIKDDDLIIIRSTVPVGTTRKIIIPLLQKSKKKFRISVCPERTVEGNALEELRSLPQIIGADDLNSLKSSEAIFNLMSPAIIKLNNLESAETVKLVNNTFRDITFGFANEIAKFCDAKSIDAIKILEAASIGYKRFNLILPGLVGGPCLEKDGHLFKYSAKLSNVNLNIISSARKINEELSLVNLKYILNKFKKIKKNFSFKNRYKISILGISFKGTPQTNDTRGSHALKIIDILKNKFKKSSIYGYDPCIQNKILKKYSLKTVNNVEKLFLKSDLLIICNNNSDFKYYDLENFSKLMVQPSLIYDFWNNFKDYDINKISKLVTYKSLGFHGRYNTGI